MKYKSKVLPSLEGVENRLNLLYNVVSGNKPMARADIIKVIAEAQKIVSKNIELIELESDDADRRGPNLV